MACKMCPEHQGLKELAAGELNTSNLQFDDYSRPGDHSQFLQHFIRKHGLFTREGLEMPLVAGAKYVDTVRAMPNNIRLMSVVSRERDLPGIFERILAATGFYVGDPDLKAFTHYLVEHIRLDSQQGGHADLLSDVQVTDEVLPFWKARLEMYREGLPVLFE